MRSYFRCNLSSPKSFFLFLLHSTSVLNTVSSMSSITLWRRTVGMPLAASFDFQQWVSLPPIWIASFPYDWLYSTVAGDEEKRKERSLTGGTLLASLLAIGSWFSIEDDRLLQWSWTPLHFPWTPQFGVLINQCSSEVVPTKRTHVQTCCLESGTWEPKPRRILENNWNFETSEHHSSAAKEQIIE